MTRRIVGCGAFFALGTLALGWLLWAVFSGSPVRVLEPHRAARWSDALLEVSGEGSALFVRPHVAFPRKIYASLRRTASP